MRVDKGIIQKRNEYQLLAAGREDPRILNVFTYPEKQNAVCH